MHILLVDDDPDDVELTTEALLDSRMEARISVCVDGVDALDYLYKRGDHVDAATPDLILLDLNMPRMNGFETLRELKADADLAAIPVVVLTTSDAERDIVEAYNLDANCVVTKPADMDAFVDAINEIEAFWFDLARLRLEPQ